MFRVLFMLFSLENCGLGKRTESLTTAFMPFLSFPARVTLRLPPSLRVCVDERTLACSHANGYFLICLTYCFCNDYGVEFITLAILNSWALQEVNVLNPRICRVARGYFEALGIDNDTNKTHPVTISSL